MKVYSLTGIVLLMGGSLLADDDELRKMAKEAGLVPLPKTQKEITLLAEQAADAKINKSTPEKVELGKKLYFDPRLSKSNLISCNTCHNLGLGGSDAVPAAIGHKWSMNPSHLNSPTVYNSVFNQVQFWDGRAAHLSAQAQGPIQAEPEMAAAPKLVEEKINSIPGYVEEFRQVYSKDVKIDFELIAETIGVFERTLITPAPFDDYLNGDNRALSDKQKEGFKIFLDKGCASCHTNINLGGSMQAFGVVKEYKFASLGGFKGDQNGMVKTPTLRNVAQTAPYFHNGAIWKLTDAIKEMGNIQLGIDISNEEASKIALFLNSLTGRKPEIIYPMLPDSTDATPTPSFD